MEKKLYTFYYNDGSYLSHQLTEEEYDNLAMRLDYGTMNTIKVGIGILVLKDIRSVVLYREPEEVKGASPDMTDEEKAWVKSMELASKLAAEEEEDDDTEYTGGMIVG